MCFCSIFPTVTLLLDFGAFGLIWLLTLSLIVFKRGFKIYKRTDNLFYKSVILGIIAFYFSRLFSFVTLADFVLYDGIVVISFSLVYLEVIGREALEDSAHNA